MKKSEDSLSELIEHHQEDQYMHYKGSHKEKRERGRKLIQRNNGREFPQIVERSRHPDSGNTNKIQNKMNPKRPTLNTSQSNCQKLRTNRGS